MADFQTKRPFLAMMEHKFGHVHDFLMKTALSGQFWSYFEVIHAYLALGFLAPYLCQIRLFLITSAFWPSQPSVLCIE